MGKHPDHSYIRLTKVMTVFKASNNPAGNLDTNFSAPGDSWTVLIPLFHPRLRICWGFHRLTRIFGYQVSHKFHWRVMSEPDPIASCFILVGSTDLAGRSNDLFCRPSKDPPPMPDNHPVTYCIICHLFSHAQPGFSLRTISVHSDKSFVSDGYWKSSHGTTRNGRAVIIEAAHRYRKSPDSRRDSKQARAPDSGRIWPYQDPFVCKRCWNP